MTDEYTMREVLDGLCCTARQDVEPIYDRLAALVEKWLTPEWQWEPYSDGTARNGAKGARYCANELAEIVGMKPRK